MNVFELAAVASPVAGILSGLVSARHARLATAGTIALAGTGALAGLGIYMVAGFMAIKLTTQAEKAGKQVARSALGLLGVILIAVSPAIAGYLCLEVLPIVARALGG